MQVAVTVKNTYCYISKNFNALTRPTQNFIVKKLSYRKKMNLMYYEEIYMLTKNPKSNGNSLAYYQLPSGLLHKFWKLAKERGVSCDLRDERRGRTTPLPVQAFFDRLKQHMPHLEKRDYQVQAIVKCLRFGKGLIQHSTGAGKTIVIAGVAYCINERTLLLCNGKEHVRQISTSMEEMTGFRVSVYGSGSKDLSGRIVVTNVQALDALYKKNRKKFALLMQEFKVVIGDEIHHAGSITYKRPFYYAVNAFWKFGFSGTMHREDGTFLEVEGAVGPILDTRDYTYLQRNDYIVPAKFYFLDPMCPIIRGEANEWPNCLHTGIVHNESRNQWLAKICALYQKHGKQVLVISPFRTEHGDILESVIPDSRFMYGSSGDGHRAEALRDFSAKEFSVLVGSLAPEEMVWIRLNKYVFAVTMKQAYHLKVNCQKEFETLSYCADGQARWKDCYAVTRHHVPEGVVLQKVRSKSNFECLVTDNHSLIGRGLKKVEPKVGNEIACPTGIWKFPQNSINIDVVKLLTGKCDNTIEIEIALSKKITWQIKSDARYLRNEEFGEKRAYNRAGDRCKHYSNDYKKTVLLIDKFFWHEKGKYRAALNDLGANAHIINRYYPAKLFVRRSRSKFSLPFVIPVTPDFAELIGWFIAEGSLHRNEKTSTYVWNIATRLNKDKKAQFIGSSRARIFSLVKKCFPNGYRTHRLGIDIRSKLIWELFNGMRCYDGDGNKRVPSFVFNSNDELKERFLRGYFYGDGHLAKERNRIQLISTSRPLIIGIYGLLRSQGVHNISWQKDARCPGNGRKEKYVLAIYEDAFGIKLKKRKAGRQIAYWHHDDFDQIKKTENLKNPEWVYDLSVVDTENFFCGTGIVAHNSRIYDEVINLPDVRCVILAGGGKAQNAFFQRVGRGIRKSSGKSHVDIIIPWDSHSSVLLKHSKANRNHIRKIEVWRDNEKIVGTHRLQYEG